jgi:PAS domain S-box-containing protein
MQWHCSACGYPTNLGLVGFSHKVHPSLSESHHGMSTAVEAEDAMTSSAFNCPDTCSTRLMSFLGGPGCYFPLLTRAAAGRIGAATSLAMESDLDPSIAMNPMNYEYPPNMPNSFTPYSFASMDTVTGSAQTPDELVGDAPGLADATMTGPGAGPLPTGFGLHSASNGTNSTVTEFTKRRNWSQRVLEEIRDFLHILTPDGRILYASASAEPLTGYKVEDLIGKFIVEYIHPDDSAIFVREFNESIATGHTMRFFYRFKKADGSYAIFESHGHPHLSNEGVAFGPINAPGFCRGFFMMARPYPTKNASLLDSFLEHKIENERLTRRISELRREEREEDEAQQRLLLQNGGQPGSPSYPPESPSVTAPPSVDQMMMPPPSKPTISNIALTQENLDEATASQKQDSINDKMARYEGATHIETIEMLTGLRYRDGERSQGISTGDTSPALIRGDAGIAIAVDKDGRNDKKKKLKVADEYVCTDCGTLDSPEWRKGPSGPKTLCNACGCRFLVLLLLQPTR